MDVVRIQYLDQENRWHTADCTLPGLKLEIGYQIYSASLRPNGKLDVIDRDGKVYHGNLQKDLNNEDAIELGYEAACLKNVSSPLVKLDCGLPPQGGPI